VKKLALIVGGLLLVMLAIAAMVSYVGTGQVMGADKVALVRIEGPIIDSQRFIDEIKQYVDDDAIKAIVLRVDSPGGAVAPS